MKRLPLIILFILSIAAAVVLLLALLSMRKPAASASVTTIPQVEPTAPLPIIPTLILPPDTPVVPTQTPLTQIEATENALRPGSGSTGIPQPTTIATTTTTSLQSTNILIPSQASWTYLADGADPGSGWTMPEFDDSQWLKGQSKFAYGIENGLTQLFVNAGVITTYFRHTFSLNSVAAYTQPLTLKLLRDDSAVVYLNGQEITRSNLPDGDIRPTTLASTSVWGDAQESFFETAIDNALLQAGENIIAVEIHQAGEFSPDMAFDLELVYDDVPPAPPGQAVISSHTNSAVFLSWGSARDNISVAEYQVFRNEALLTTVQTVNFIDNDLIVGETYSYTIRALDSAGNFSPFTSPTPFTPPPPINACNAQTSFAVIGDYGTTEGNTADVAAMIKAWQPDFIATTGDNNYPDGTAETIDENIGQFYHDYIFDYAGIYGPGSPQIRYFPILGGHDWHTENAQPFFDYFTLPGNEHYYDVVWGPVHLFFLSSEPEEPDGHTVGSVQAQWLENNLTASTTPWQIVVTHSPPYSSGNRHGSKRDAQWPYAAWGADAVIAGSDHLYERIFRDDIFYFVNGLGGAPWFYDFVTPVTGSEARFNGDNGAMLVSVGATCMQFQFATRAGIIVDDFVIGR